MAGRRTVETVTAGGGSGGGGGNIFLVFGILFFGYLYFSRRLPNVAKAIATPANALTMAVSGGTPASGGVPPAAPTGPSTGGSQPPVLPPVGSLPGERHDFVMIAPMGYSFDPIPVSVYPGYCAITVYSDMLAATGSPGQASRAVTQYCAWDVGG